MPGRLPGAAQSQELQSCGARLFSSHKDSIVTDWGLVCTHELAWICVCAHMCTLIGAWQAYAYCGVEEGEQAAASVHVQCCDHAFFPEYVFVKSHQTQVRDLTRSKIGFIMRKQTNNNKINTTWDQIGAMERI